MFLKSWVSFCNRKLFFVESLESSNTVYADLGSQYRKIFFLLKNFEGEFLYE